VLVGLYNKYGRVFTDIRRIIFRLTGDRLLFLDPRLNVPRIGNTKKDTWHADQYQNPHESKHTMGELLQWFDKTGFEFTYGVPSPKAFDSFRSDDSIFTPRPSGARIDHALVQLHFLLRGSREGGLFIMIGRKH